MTRYVLALPYKTPPLSLNDRKGFREVAREVKELRLLAAVWGRSLGLGELPWVRAELFWFVADGRRRDAENPVPTLKALCDGVVDAGIVKDDTPEFMEKLMPAIVREEGPDARPRVEFVLSATRGTLSDL